MMGSVWLIPLLVTVSSLISLGTGIHSGEQPLSRIAIHRTRFEVLDSAYVKASPALLGLKVLMFDALQVLCPCDSEFIWYF